MRVERVLLFALDFQKGSATPTSKNQPERARCCLTFANREGAAWHRERAGDGSHDLAPRALVRFVGGAT
jgi:hypothetical protein